MYAYMHIYVIMYLSAEWIEISTYVSQIDRVIKTN